MATSRKLGKIDHGRAGELYDEDILDSVLTTKIPSTLGSATKVLYQTWSLL